MEMHSKYETVFVVKPDYDEEAAKGMLEKFTGLIAENGGAVEKVDEWGKRRLAYPIEDFTDGIYYVVTFTAPAELPAELDRVFGITDGILRSIIVKLDK